MDQWFSAAAPDSRLRAWCAGLAVILSIATPLAQSRPPELGSAGGTLPSLKLPGPAESLATALGLPADTPRARLLVDVIKLAYAAPAGQSRDADAARAALHEWLDSAGGATSSGSGVEDARNDRLVPSPLPEASWRDLASRLDVAGVNTAAVVLRDRRLALVYVGVLGCTSGTRAFLVAHSELLETIARRHAGAFAAFGRSLVIEHGRMQLPGGPQFDALWRALAGETPEDPELFIRQALAKERGRFAWFLDVVTHLGPGAQRFVLGGASASRKARESSATALADLFASQETKWTLDDRPFARPSLDGHVVLTSLRFSESGGWIGPGSQRFWRDVFEGREPPDDQRRWITEVVRYPAVDAPFLVGSIVDVDVEKSRSRLAAVRFVQRRFSEVPPDQWTDVLRAAQAMVAAPALVLVLERAGLVEPGDYARAFERARGLTHLTRQSDTPIALGQFQAALAVVDALRQRRALTPDATRGVIASLVRLKPARGGYGPALADWVRGELLASLSTGGAPPDTADTIVVRGLAGPSAGTDRPEISWEGLRYRFDPAVAETRRLTELLRLQRAPALADALVFAAAAKGVNDASDLASVTAALPALEGAAIRLGQLKQPLFAPSPKSVSAAGLVAPVVERARDGRRELSPGDRELLQATADSALTEALLSLCYARHLGDPQGPISLAPDVARRHMLIPEDGQRRIRDRDAWQPPESRRSEGAGGWRITGSLLMLDHALADLALQPIDGTAMPAPPRLAGAGQLLLAMSVIAMDPWALDDEGADTLGRQIGRGREQVRARCAPGSDQTAGAWSRWRVATAQWACVHDPGSVERLWTLTDLALAAPPASPSGLDSWGSLEPILEGSLMPRWPSSRPLDDLEGRPATGRSVAPFVELTLRILPVIRAHSLPVAFLPAVLSTAMFDLLHDAPLAYADDWFRLARHAAELSDEQIEDYMAAQASRGPLVPVDQGR